MRISDLLLAAGGIITLAGIIGEILEPRAPADPVFAACVHRYLTELSDADQTRFYQDSAFALRVTAPCRKPGETP
jgi:hypothetical protein